jgi:hypothetical protein
MSRADGRGGIGLFRSKIGSRGSVGKVGGAHLPNAARLHCLASLCSDDAKTVKIDLSDLMITFGARPERQKMADRGAGDPLWKQHLDGAQR